MMSEFQRQLDQTYDRMQRFNVINAMGMVGLPGSTVEIMRFYEGGPLCFVARSGKEFLVCSIVEQRLVTEAEPGLLKEGTSAKLAEALAAFWDQRIQPDGRNEGSYVVTYGNARARCGMELNTLPDGRLQVTFTELADNPGRSVTNAIEELTELVMLWRDLPLDRLRIIEHYPTRRRTGETFDEVTFKLNDPLPKLPEWKRLPPAEALFLARGTERS